MIHKVTLFIVFSLLILFLFSGHALKLIMSLTERTVNIAEIDHFSNEMIINLNLPKDGRGWSLYAKDVDNNDYLLNEQVSLSFKSSTDKDVSIFFPDENEQKVFPYREIKVTKNQEVIIYEGTVGSLLKAMKEFNTVDNKNGTFSIVKSFAHWRNPDIQVSGFLIFRLNGAITLNSRIKLYSYLPGDTL